MSKESKMLFKVAHEEPNDYRWDYIVLPYSAYYPRSVEIMKARPGDMLRFFEGRDVEITAVHVIEDADLCNTLCRMRYGISWAAAFDRWRRNAVLDGNGRDILSRDKCIMVAFKWL